MNDDSPKHLRKVTNVITKGNKCLLVPIFGEGNGSLPQYSCLENPMDGGAW